MGSILIEYHQAAVAAFCVEQHHKGELNEGIARYSCNCAHVTFGRLHHKHNATARTTWSAGTDWTGGTDRAAGRRRAGRTSGPDRTNGPDGTNGPDRPTGPGRTMSGRTASPYQPRYRKSELRVGLSSIELFMARVPKRNRTSGNNCHWVPVPGGSLPLTASFSNEL